MSIQSEFTQPDKEPIPVAGGGAAKTPWFNSPPGRTSRPSESRHRRSQPERHLRDIVQADDAIVVIIKIPKVVGVTPASAEMNSRVHEFQDADVVVAIHVAEEPVERIRTTAPRVAIAIRVGCLAQSVVNLAAVNGQRVVAVRQRTADNQRPAEGHHYLRLAAGRED